ncbi:hypothetical protein SAMN04488136_103255 [Vibrio xiamenensis]|uniref:Beta-barrel assembly machine subunit BamE n=1 Tax=Vibrio xiamenensis TaxID=861298 RepID=A0A1G7XM14_9VIBR|nr:hypothetical protein [Vibrio xiamenensis]SDG85192.1 hypothetical protein SAMN04488136_103255 [Vibrio xiamenensis]
MMTKILFATSAVALIAGCVSRSQLAENSFESKVKIDGYHESQQMISALIDGKIQRVKQFSYVIFNDLATNRLTYITAKSPMRDGFIAPGDIERLVKATYSVYPALQGDGYEINFHQSNNKMNISYQLDADQNGNIEDFIFKPYE